MFLRIENVPRDYAWGSRTAIAEVLGREPSGSPEAELWLGAHPGSPSRIVHPHHTDGAEHLAEWIERDPESALGDLPSLPFLLKLLAADSPLSLQAHPSLDRAREGFERENAAGIPVDAPHRNYKDPLHKPEAVVALSETFDALCGFRPIDESREIAHVLAEADRNDPTGEPEIIAPLVRRLNGDDPLRTTVGWLLGGGAEVDALVGRVTALVKAGTGLGSAFAESFRTAQELARVYPGDPGIVISLLLNRVTLRRGEALYLPAGNVHAYLSGLAVEIMAASDNVLRGGLTPKHIDVGELVDVLEFTPVPVPRLEPRELEAGLAEFRPDVPDFVLVRAEPTSDISPTYEPDGPAIALCVAGSVQLKGERSSVEMLQGESVYIAPGEGRIRFTGVGTVFVAAPGDSEALRDRQHQHSR